MAKPLLAALAYETFLTNTYPTRPTPWHELSFTERIAWGKVVHAVVMAAHSVPCPLHIEIETTADLWRQAKRKALRHDKTHAGPRAPKKAKGKRLLNVA
jgi:hypothetical protein